MFSSLNQALSLQSTAVDPFVGFSPINTWIALSFGTIWSYVISKMKNGEVSPHDLICGSICVQFSLYRAVLLTDHLHLSFKNPWGQLLLA